MTTYHPLSLASEFEVRQMALEKAVQVNEDPETNLRRAKLYMDFLRVPARDIDLLDGNELLNAFDEAHSRYLALGAELKRRAEAGIPKTPE